MLQSPDPGAPAAAADPLLLLLAVVLTGPPLLLCRSALIFSSFSWRQAQAKQHETTPPDGPASGTITAEICNGKLILSDFGD